MITPEDVLTYMGIKNGDGSLLEFARKAVCESMKAAEFSAVGAFYDILPVQGGVTIAGVTFQSGYLAKKCKGASRVLAFCCTLGAGADRLLSTISAVDMGFACYLDAAFHALLDDELERWVGDQTGKIDGFRGKTLVRVCPGYGDWDPKDVGRLLPLANARYIGVGCTGGFMLTPAKSLTGFYAAVQHENGQVHCSQHSCSDCIHPCSLRRDP